MSRYEEVMEAIANQSIIGRPGRIGQSTGIAVQSKEYVLVYQRRYNKPEQYEDIRVVPGVKLMIIGYF